jgi:hypothetical protein
MRKYLDHIEGVSGARPSGDVHSVPYEADLDVFRRTVGGGVKPVRQP